MKKMPRWPSQGTEIERGMREAPACVVVVLYCDFIKFLGTDLVRLSGRSYLQGGVWSHSYFPVI